MTISTRELNSNEAYGYVRECLRQGHSLASFLLEELDLAKGRIITFLPSEISDEDAMDFKTGKLEVSPETVTYVSDPDGSQHRMELVPVLYDPLVTYVHRFLGLDDNRICVFENNLAEPQDSGLVSLTSRMMVHKNEVYHVLLDSDLDPDTIEQTIRDAQSWQLVGALSYLSAEEVLSIDTGIFSTEQLRRLAVRTEHIIVRAYDGESYLIWSNL